MKDKIFAFAFSVLLSLLASATAHASWPHFPHAPNMESEWIADQLVYNGVPMWVEQFHCICSTEKVLDYYRRRWGRLEYSYVENQVGEFKQISRGDEGFFYTVQVKEKPNSEGESHGRLSITAVPPHGSEPPELGAGVPQPGFSQILNDIHDAVPGKKIRTVALYNDLDMMSNTNYYRAYFSQKGWKSMLQTVAPEKGSQALSFTKEGRDVNIVIYPGLNGQSNILYNEVEVVQ